MIEGVLRVIMPPLNSLLLPVLTGAGISMNGWQGQNRKPSYVNHCLALGLAWVAAAAGRLRSIWMAGSVRWSLRLGVQDCSRPSWAVLALVSSHDKSNLTPYFVQHPIVFSNQIGDVQEPVISFKSIRKIEDQFYS